MSVPTVEGRRFSIGKYHIVATPITYSAHMLRYTVYVEGRRNLLPLPDGFAASESCETVRLESLATDLR